MNKAMPTRPSLPTIEISPDAPFSIPVEQRHDGVGRKTDVIKRVLAFIQDLAESQRHQLQIRAADDSGLQLIALQVDGFAGEWVYWTGQTPCAEKRRDKTSQFAVGQSLGVLGEIEAQTKAVLAIILPALDA